MEHMNTPHELARFDEVLRQRVTRCDLEAHLLALMDCFWLRTPGISPLFHVLSNARVPDVDWQSSPHTALVGCRIALGLWTGSTVDFVHAAEREMHRRPLRPFPSIHDDERIMLGVAAGVGATAPSLKPAMLRMTRADLSRPFRTQCLNIWAQWLLLGDSNESFGVTRSAVQLLDSMLRDHRVDDSSSTLAALWLAWHIVRLNSAVARLDISNDLLLFVQECESRLPQLLNEVDLGRGLDLALVLLAPRRRGLAADSSAPGQIVPRMQESVGRSERFRQLLLDCFNEDTFRLFVRYVPNGEKLTPQLPGKSVSWMQLASDAVSLFEHTRLVNDPTFWQHLLVEREGWAADIEQVRDMYLVPSI